MSLCLRYGWYLVFLTLPLFSLDYMRIGFGDQKIPLFFVITMAIGLVSVIRFFFTKECTAYFTYEHSMFLALLLILFMVHIGNLTRSDDYIRGSADIIKLFSCIFTFITIALFFPKGDHKIFYQLMILSSTLMMLVYLYHYIFILNSPYLSNGWEEISEEGKNQIGLYLAVITPFVFWNAWKAPFWGGTCFVIHLFAVIYTFSRGTWLCLAVSFLLILGKKLVVKHNWKKNLTKLISIVIMLTAIPAIYYFLPLNDEFNTLLTQKFQSLIHFEEIEGRYSMDFRKDFIIECLEYFSQAPIWGIGTSNFFIRQSWYTHNDYLQIAAEHGVLGFLLFSCMMLVIVQKTLFLPAASWDRLGLIQSSLVLVLYLGIINAYNTVFPYVFWAILMGIDSNIKENTYNELTIKGKEFG